MRDETTSGRIRTAAMKLQEFTSRDIADAIEVRTYAEKKKVSAHIRKFLQRGEMERAGEKRYRYVFRNPQVTMWQRMWNVVRRMSTPFFRPADIRQMTGVSTNTVKPFCSWLAANGYAERVALGRYRRVGKWAVNAPPRVKGASS